MKSILKIIKALFITLVVILVLLITVSLILQGRITRIFSNEVNKYVETGIEVEKVGFSLLSGFPRATVEFKNIVIKSPVSGDPWLDSLQAENQFLKAEMVNASFNIRDLIRKEYTIDRVTIKNSMVYLFSDSLGSSTGRIFKVNNTSDSSKISFDLKNIRIENTGFKFLSNKKNFVLDCSVDNAIGRLSLSEGRTEIQTKTGFNLNTISSSGQTILKPMEDGLIEGVLTISADSICFKQLDFSLDNQPLGINGYILTKEKELSLNINSGNSDPGLLFKYLPSVKDIPPGAKLGGLDLSLNLRFESPLESFSAMARSYQLEYAGNFYTGSFSIKDLLSPTITLDINGELDFKELHKLHRIPGIESIAGVAHLNARIYGSPGRLKDLKAPDLLELERRMNIHLSGVDIKPERYEYPLESISGNVMIAENAWGDELSLMLSGQNIIMNCQVNDFNNLFLNNGGPINITAGIWADKLDSRLFIPETDNEERAEADPDLEGRDGETIIERLNAELNLNIDSLIIDDFSCSQFDGIIKYRPGFLNISSFNMLALNGSLSGNTALIRDSGGSYLARGLADIEAVDINRAFRVFKNFGQEEILAENLKGELSGSVSVSAKMDSSFKLIQPSLSLTGNYSIYNGELINFEPVLKLSRFIEVSELEDIKFEKLQNDLIISDRRLMIPSMEINSSAFNISLSGEQDFSGDFEYHLQVLLSEILSRKATNSGSYVSEFGPIEDDGLGRTTLYLKLEKGENGTNVSYDVKKLSEEIKVSLQEEKQSLKTILNEEYGWYNNDSLSNTTKSDSRKFRITWEEADSVKTVKEPVEAGRSGLFKKIFKSDTTKKKF